MMSRERRLALVTGSQTGKHKKAHLILRPNEVTMLERRAHNRYRLLNARRVLLALTLVTSTVNIGCVLIPINAPPWGYVRDPIRLVDKESGAAIPEALIIGSDSAYLGFLIAEAGWAGGRFRLARYSVVRTGQRPALPERFGAGLQVYPWGFIGAFASRGGGLIIAPGYQVRSAEPATHRYERRRATQWRLIEFTPAENPVDELRRVIDLIERRSIRRRDDADWEWLDRIKITDAIDRQGSLEIQLSQRDRDTVRAYLEKSIMCLSGQPAVDDPMIASEDANGAETQP